MSFRIVRHKNGSGPASSSPVELSTAQRARFRRLFVVGNKNECWNFTGFIDGAGYGKFQTSVNGVLQPAFAHRVSFTIAKGPIPTGMCVLHSCDNRRCVNPSHLSLGDHKENMRQAQERGRMKSNGAAFSQECTRGHFLGGFNRSLDGHHCRFCVMLNAAEKAAYAEDAFHTWMRDVVRPKMPPTFAELVQLVGEKDAKSFAFWTGSYGYPMLSLDAVGKAQGVSRQRVDQRRVRAMKILGIYERAPRVHRASLDARAA